ncbi:MAG: hypothetical protein ABSG76_20815 [Xanthobacteraceae bacterium]
MTYQQSDMTSPGDWLVDTMRRKPEALLLMAAGCALLMRSGMRSARRNTGSIASRMASSEQTGRIHDPGALRSATSALGDGVGRAAGTVSDYVGGVAGTVGDTAKSYASNVADNVSEYAGAARQAVSDYADSAQRTLSQTSDRLKGQAESTYQSASEAIREQPILVAALGLAAGAAVAALFPSTDIERRTLGAASDALTGAAAGAGKKLLDAASEAGDRLKDSASERGLDADGLKDMAREVAGTFATAAGGTEQDRRRPSDQTTHSSTPAPRPDPAGSASKPSPSSPAATGSSSLAGRASQPASSVGSRDARSGERSPGNDRRQS